jgi:hypothetical protein
MKNGDDYLRSWLEAKRAQDSVAKGKDVGYGM